MRNLCLVFVAVAAGMTIGTMPVAASCLPPMPIDQALRSSDSVFVGTVARIANGGRTATFTVDEVWRGPDLPAETAVIGGPEGNSITSVDRSWEANGKYLVFAAVVDGELTDNACSNTQLWSDELGALRPSNARPPSDAVNGKTVITGPMLALVVSVAVIGVVAFVAFRNRPRST